MIEALVLIAIIWVGRRAVVWLLLRTAAFAVGFNLGWKLMGRR